MDGVTPQIASMEGTHSSSQDTCNSTPLGLPPDSLYVHGIIQDTPAFMLVDTGAFVTAVSSSLFAIAVYSYFKKCCRGERRMSVVERRLHD